MRAREPDEAGYAVNDGVRIYYEVHGAGPQTVLFIAPHQIVHSRIWKMQVPFLARHYRTVVYDGRGNGRSDRPTAGYLMEQLVGDAIAVLDELGITQCALVTEGSASRPAVVLAVRQPRRVGAMVLFCPRFSGAPKVAPGEWEVWKRRYIAEYDETLRHLIWVDAFPEPHSTVLHDDYWAWAHQTDPRIIVTAAEECWADADVRPLLPQVRCPVLLIHGRHDRVVPYEQSLKALATLPYAGLATIETRGSFPAGRDPVRMNLMLREFLSRHGARQPVPAGARVTR
ncbi:MAG: alpha/beta fold hydrolase [Armatimonadota bacterium]